MTAVVSKPDTLSKLKLLSSDAQYDLACACGTSKDDHRRAGADGNWIYPVTLPNGGSSVLFKTLVSNICSNDCKYCPLRCRQDIPRTTLNIEETAGAFMHYLNAGKVFGLFLSSGVIGTPDATMERLNTIARVIRQKHRFKGYIHLKIIPGASAEAIKQAVSLASAVSINIETPGQEFLSKLSARKNFLTDIVESIKLVSSLTAAGAPYRRVKQTTQFVVGAAGESDKKILQYTDALYRRLKMHRVYFSAYQKESVGGFFESPRQANQDNLAREHRLYQADFLFRRYGFCETELLYEAGGNLCLDTDPKSAWAKAHPEFFPVNVNKADKFELLRVPGLGPKTVSTILQRRKIAGLCSLDQIGKPNKLLQKASPYLSFS